MLGSSQASRPSLVLGRREAGLVPRNLALPGLLVKQLCTSAFLGSSLELCMSV